jgi:hypothetical protein
MITCDVGALMRVPWVNRQRKAQNLNSSADFSIEAFELSKLLLRVKREAPPEK